MKNIEMLRQQINHLIIQARNDIYTLSTLSDMNMKPPNFATIMGFTIYDSFS